MGFQSPAWNLLGLLAQRKAEARQAMLDDIHRRDVESNMRYREENLASLQEEREARRKLNEEAANEKWLKTSGLEPGSPVSDPTMRERITKINPNLIRKGTPGITGESGAVVGGLGSLPSFKSKTGNPEVDVTGADSLTSEAPSTVPAGPDTYAGLPEQVETKRKTDLRNRLLSDPGAFEGMDDLTKSVLIHEAFGMTPNADMLGHNNQTFAVVDEKTGQVTVDDKPVDPNKLPKNTHFYTKPQPRYSWTRRPDGTVVQGPEIGSRDVVGNPPRPPGSGGGGHNWVMGQMPDPNDPNKTISVMYDPRDPKAAPIPVDFHRPYAPPRTSNSPSGLYDEGAMGRYLAAVRSQNRNDEGPALSAWIQTFKDPHLKDDFTSIMYDSSLSNKSVAAILVGVTAPPGVDEAAYKSQLAAVLRNVGRK